MGIHLLCCIHGNEHTKTHDAICNTFATIAQNVDFHMKWEKLHAFLSTTFNSSHWRIDIVLTKDGIRTLINIVIANPMWIDLLSWYCASEASQMIKWVYIKYKS
jgi:hypothetical protein